MCLHSVTDREPKPEETGIGWKVIEVQGMGFYGPFYNQTHYPFGEWIKAVPFKELVKLPPGQPNYTPGFHIFLNEQDAKIYLKEYIYPVLLGIKDFNIVKVEYKGVLCRGITRIRNDDVQCLDWHLTTLVVENMLVPEPK
jgi:hypothetical protein